MTPNRTSKFNKKDLFFSVITGVTAGLIAALIAGFLDAEIPGGVPPFSLVVIIPILWALGINLGYTLGRYIGFFTQFGKFAAIGFTNFAVDAGVLNLLIALSGIAAGFWFGVFKALSFLAASIHSYFWNKYWVFDAGDNPANQFGKFFAVSVAAAVVNVAVAYFVVNFVPSPLDPKVWANVGAIIGSATALIVSFVGFRLAVFKR